jgi:hypothetical protein
MSSAPDDSGLVFISRGKTDAAMEICVNFGLFAGRDVTGWEIERLGTWLLDEVDALTAISEQRHEIGRTGGGAIHQVRVEIAAAQMPETGPERRQLEQRIVERVDHWARVCIAERHGQLEDT